MKQRPVPMSRGGRLRAVAPVLALWVVAACATPPTRQLDADHALCWEVRNASGAPGTVYLLGSVHVGPDRPLELGPVLADAFDRSDELWVEAEMPESSSPEVVKGVQERGMLPAEESLEAVITPETYLELQKYAKERHLDTRLVSQMRPWLVALMVETLELQAKGYDQEQGIDRFFMARARGKKPIRAFETLDEQLGLLSGLSPQLQDAMLRDALREANESSDTSERILAAWEAGDAERLDELLLGGTETRPELAVFYEKVFFERNDRMSDRIAQLVRDGGTRFVVVGAGHLVGARGIVRTLESRGFAVTRLRSGSAPPAPGIAP
jgi:hypothetical protein